MYRQQVDLLLQVLPHVAKENVFALKGGTAINLFVRDMPRLSVDIDLTYLPLDDRDTAMRGISEALNHIRQKISCNPYPPHYRTSFAFSSILYPHSNRSLQFDRPVFRARIRAYRVPQREYANDFGPVFPPVGIIVSVNPIMREFTYPRTFWLKPVSNFGFSTLTMVINSSPELAISP